MTGPRLSVVIVAFNHRDELARTLPPLVEQLREGDELIVADNGSKDDTIELVAELAPGAELVEMGSNTGFAAAANEGAEVAAGELLVFLNPDARPLEGFTEAIRRPWVEGRDWAAWMALVACDGGRTINTSGNPVHYTGFAWAGDHGRPLSADLEPREVPSASGACLALPLETFERLGGFPDRYFLYHEDVDLSMRLRLEGGAIGLEPGAVVDHDYEFDAGAAKMRWLERNRWAFLVRVYPAPLLILLAPALLATELALIPVSIAGGWGWQKLLANLDGLARLPWALRTRREIQRRRQISAAEFAAWLTPELDSPFFGRVGRSRLLRGGLRAYWRMVTTLLGIGSGSGQR